MMVKLLRVDDRLLHGQVAFIWTSSLNISTIVVANDDAANDEFIRLTLELGRPRGVQLIIDEIETVRRLLEDESFNKKNILLIVNSIKDAIGPHGLLRGSEINQPGWFADETRREYDHKFCGVD